MLNPTAGADSLSVTCRSAPVPISDAFWSKSRLTPNYFRNPCGHPAFGILKPWLSI